MASAIAYAWFATEVKKSTTVPLIQTLRSDLRLRAENLYALSKCGFEDESADPEKLDILCLDDLPESPSFPSHKFSLVDHNRLGSYFTKDNPNVTVVSVVDHHDDEKLYKDTADPRIITATGSCASLVADLIRSQCPAGVTIIPELANLLICSILIDTSGLKPGGKVTERDQQAMAYLLPHSTFDIRFQTPLVDIDPKTFYNIPALKDRTKELKTRKEDLSSLNTKDILRRDYKEYTFVPSWAKDSQIRVGVTSAPIGFKSWIPQHKDFYTAIEGWIKERNIAALIILTSFSGETEFKKKSKKKDEEKKDEEKKGKEKKGKEKKGKEKKDEEKKDKEKDEEKSKGKHKRQLLVVVADNKDLASALFPGLENSKQQLHLEERTFKKFEAKKATGDFGGVLQAKVYKQGNVEATRKTVAPIIKEVVEGSPGASL